MTKTVSSRIPKDLYDKLKEKCDNEGCNTNDFIRDVLENELEQEPKEEPKPKEPKPSLEEIPELKNPKIVVTDFNPDNYEIKSEPKPIIKEIPQDNSNKPPIEMVLFNGKYIQKAEVYEI